MTLRFVVDSLRALVTSEARARVLTALYLAPERRFYQQELARESGLPLLAVQRELRRLSAAGLIATEVVGGRRLYAADRSSPVYRELQGLVFKLRGPAAALRRAFAGRPGVDLAWIFGSFAAGAGGAASDIDVMVLGAASPRSLRSIITPLERELDRSINEHVIVPVEWRRRLSRRDSFLGEVRRGPKLWLLGDDEALGKLDPRKRA